MPFRVVILCKPHFCSCECFATVLCIPCFGPIFRLSHPTLLELTSPAWLSSRSFLLPFSGCPSWSLLGSFSNDDGDGNQDVKKAVGLLRKTTTLHVRQAFLYISSPSLDDYNMKMPNCKVYGGRKQATSNLFFSL